MRELDWTSAVLMGRLTVIYHRIINLQVESGLRHPTRLKRKLSRNSGNLVE